MPKSRPKPKLPQLAAFGANVRRERVARGVTQEKLAELMEVNPRTIQKIEAGKLNIPDYHPTIAEGLGLFVGFLDAAIAVGESKAKPACAK